MIKKDLEQNTKSGLNLPSRKCATTYVKVSFNVYCEVFLIYRAQDDCILCSESDCY